MATALEIMNHRVTLAVGVLVLVGAGLGFMDARHASAEDVKQLTLMIAEDRIEELEFKIEDIEDKSIRLLAIQAEDIEPRDVQEMESLANRKARYIRKLNRLLGVN